MVGSIIQWYLISRRIRYSRYFLFGTWSRVKFSNGLSSAKVPTCILRYFRFPYTTKSWDICWNICASKVVLTRNDEERLAHILKKLRLWIENLWFCNILTLFQAKVCLLNVIRNTYRWFAVEVVCLSVNFARNEKEGLGFEPIPRHRLNYYNNFWFKSNKTNYYFIFYIFTNRRNERISNIRCWAIYGL